MVVFKEHYIKFILYMAVIVLVNIAGLNLFFRADLTGNKIFSLSEASKKAAATLSEPLSIKVFFPKPARSSQQHGTLSKGFAG